jgi:GNAT superfamily N-acetyltransferase
MPVLSAFPVHLRAAKKADIAFLLELRQVAMGPHRLTAGIEETDDQASAKVQKDFDVAFVVLHNDERIGLFKARKDASPWSISQVQLLPNWQGQGIGTELVSRFVAEARTHGEAVELDVLKVNPARRMYERMGFKVIAEGTHGLTLRTEA